jgi:hypothetical protein
MRRFYGAGPIHLLAGLASFALAGWALAQALDVLATPGNFLLWLGGATVAHDFVLFPLYSLLGRGAVAAAAAEHDRVRIAALNHVRVPALLSGLAFLVWFPLILGMDAEVFERISASSNDVYLERWLLLTGVLFGGSALAFAVRLRRLT